MEAKRLDSGTKYVLVVDNQALFDKAIELGYKETVLFDGLTPTNEQISALISEKKIVVIAAYDTNNCGALASRLREQEVQVMIWWSEPDNCETIDEAIAYFPEPDSVVDSLTRHGYSKSTDYNLRCGHCQAELRPEDRYCQMCGTESGKGEFLPYDNVMYCVYGPPIKKKHKCSSCGYIWINVRLGGDRAEYCPHCGKHETSVIQEKVAWDFVSIFGTAEPMGEDEVPELLTESQLEAILKQRDPHKRFWGDDLFTAMRKAGFDVPNSIADEDGHRTEFQGEQYNLAAKILSSSGKYSDGGDIHCPKCGSTRLAAYSYIKQEAFEQCLRRVGQRRSWRVARVIIAC